MGTNCVIIEKTAKGLYRGIYCHFGDPVEIGTILTNFYPHHAIVSELIDLGDLSVLGAQLVPTGPDHSFNKPEPNVTVAYARDRKEPLRITCGKSLDAVIGKLGVSHVFEFRADSGYWHYNGLRLASPGDFSGGPRRQHVEGD